jgi:ribosome-associated toxin RatA of RatAB toxin-antitoxin module
MAKHQFSVSALVQSQPKIVYSIIADYKNSHPKILPKPPFVSLVVEEGGFGAGSVLKVQMKVAGKIQTFKTVVTEPEPGRILVETNDTGYITTFTVEPHNDGKNSYVTFTTEIPDNSKLSKKLEFFFTKFYLPLVYKKELQMLAEEALNQSKTNQ